MLTQLCPSPNFPYQVWHRSVITFNPYVPLLPPSQVWHPDVRFYQVVDKQGAPLAFFFLDPYSRPAEKRGGAWMDSVCGRSRVMAPGGSPVRLPVAHMVCNQTPPLGDEPSLMTFREVRREGLEGSNGGQLMGKQGVRQTHCALYLCDTHVVCNQAPLLRTSLVS